MPSINILETTHIYELTAPVADPELPVLVFVHGWLLSRHYWQPLVQLLQSQYQCLVYDARGFGESQAEQKSLSEVPNSSLRVLESGKLQFACLCQRFEVLTRKFGNQAGVGSGTFIRR